MIKILFHSNVLYIITRNSALHIVNERKGRNVFREQLHYKGKLKGSKFF